jgi:hypothetical protein
MIAESPYDGEDPLKAWADHPGLWEVFEDESDLLLELQTHWLNLLTREVYGAPQYPLGEEPVLELYTRMTSRFPALRAILAEHQDDYHIFEAVQEEQILLARAAGNLHHVSPLALSLRGRDLLDTIPAQRGS